MKTRQEDLREGGREGHEDTRGFGDIIEGKTRLDPVPKIKNVHLERTVTAKTHPTCENHSVQTVLPW